MSAVSARYSELPKEQQRAVIRRLCATVAEQMAKEIRAEERARRKAKWEPYAKGQSNTPKRKPKAERPQCEAMTKQNRRCQARVVWVSGRKKPRRYCHLHTPRPVG